MNVYAHVSLDDKRQALDKLGNLFEEEAEGARWCQALVSTSEPSAWGSRPSGPREHKSPGQRVAAWAFGLARSEGFEPPTF